MFPIVEYAEETQGKEVGKIGRSFTFDYKTNRFEVIEGVVSETSKIKAIEQWIELFIRVEMNKYKIYSSNFGTNLSDLLGYRLPRGYQVSEIIRRINEGIINNCPDIVKVSDWNFDNGTFTFIVTTSTGEEVVING